jgi:hypothetical protein
VDRGTHTKCTGNGPLGSTKEKEKEDAESEEAELQRFAWQAEVVDLPEDLLLVLQKIGAGETLDAKRLLEELPKFRGLKDRAETNNHQLDSKKKFDQILKQVQQRLLNFMRGFACLHSTIQD